MVFDKTTNNNFILPKQDLSTFINKSCKRLATRPATLAIKRCLSLCWFFMGSADQYIHGIRRLSLCWHSWLSENLLLSENTMHAFKKGNGYGATHGSSRFKTYSTILPCMMQFE